MPESGRSPVGLVSHSGSVVSLARPDHVGTPSDPRSPELSRCLQIHPLTPRFPRAVRRLENTDDAQHFGAAYR